MLVFVHRTGLWPSYDKLELYRDFQRMLCKDNGLQEYMHSNVSTTEERQVEVPQDEGQQDEAPQDEELRQDEDYFEDVSHVCFLFSCHII